jgi:hypothetical protein
MRIITTHPPPPRLEILSIVDTAISDTAMSSLRAWARVSDRLHCSFDAPAPPMMMLEDEA